MNARNSLTVLLLVALAACGSSDSTFTLAAGNNTYAVSGGTATAQGDDCDMAVEFQASSPPIRIDVSGSTARFDLSGTNPTAANEWVVTTINGNAITNTTAASYTKAVAGTTCQYTQRMTVSGDITANNQLAATAVYTKTTNTGFTCTAADMGATRLTNGACTSGVHFLASKSP